MELYLKSFSQSFRHSCISVSKPIAYRRWSLGSNDQPCLCQPNKLELIHAWKAGERHSTRHLISSWLSKCLPQKLLLNATLPAQIWNKSFWRVILSHKRGDPRWNDALLRFSVATRSWNAEQATALFLLVDRPSSGAFISTADSAGISACLASRYGTVLRNNVHVFLSLPAFQLKLGSAKMRLASVTNVFFGAQLLLGAKKKEKRCTASLKRLVGIKLEGLEIEWTTRALGCYLGLSRAPAGSSSQQNAALGCVKGAQITAHPLTGFDPSTQDGASQSSWVLDDCARESETRIWPAVSCILLSGKVCLLSSLYQRWMNVHAGRRNWLITVWLLKSNWSWNVTSWPRALTSLAFRVTQRLRLLFRTAGRVAYCVPLGGQAL